MSTITPTYYPHIPQTRIKCLHTYGVRYCPCCPFATKPCRPTACFSLAQPPADHCPLTPVRWTYTFSAKEKDAETQYSYFGSRYYSSNLSIWLSVDPMAAKYPHQSNYVYCSNNPIRIIDPNGMFDDEAKAIKFRNRAAKRYGEDRVSDVYNNTIDGGKANYAFSIYGKGKSKRSYSGGTNEQGGPIIACDKPDKVVTTGKDFKAYNRSHRSRYSVRVDASISFGAQAGDYMDIKGRKLGVNVNVGSVDVAGISISKQHGQPIAFDYHTISPDATKHNTGFTIGPIFYEHAREYHFNNIVDEAQTINVLGYNLYSSDPSKVASLGIGVRLGIGFDFKINLIRK